jgi:hypothetical protein
VLLNGKAPAFQAGHAGSIPATRSILKPAKPPLNIQFKGGFLFASTQKKRLPLRAGVF